MHENWLLNLRWGMLCLCLLCASCKKDPLDGDAHARRGIELLQQDKATDGLQQLKLALDQGVTFQTLDEVHRHLGWAYKAMGQHEQAIASLKQAISINVDNIGAWQDLGSVYQMLRNFNEAERCYKTALELQPDHLETLVSIGLLYVEVGDFDQAIFFLEKLFASNKRYAWARAHLAVAYAKVGRNEDSSLAVEQAIALGFEDKVMLQNIIEMQQKEASDE